MPEINNVNNIRLILDMIYYHEFIPDESFIPFVDFYKAFDTVSHQFMFKVIRFGIGNAPPLVTEGKKKILCEGLLSAPLLQLPATAVHTSRLWLPVTTSVRPDIAR